MKKMISILMALMMLCALLPASAEGADVTGVWYLSVLKMGDTELSPAMMGLEMSFDLKADGSAKATVVNSDGTNEEDLSWALNEEGALVITEDGESRTFTVGEGRLEGDIGGAVGVFTQEAPAAVEKPAPVDAESEEAFFGTWKLSQVEMDGALMPVDLLAGVGVELSAALTVEAGKASAAITMFGFEVPAIEGATTFADGALSMKVEDLETPIAINLCDSGELYMVVSVAMMDTALPMYFVKAE